MLLHLYKWRCSHTLVSLPAVIAQLWRSGLHGDLRLSVPCLLPACLLSHGWSASPLREHAWPPLPFWTCVGMWSPTCAPAAWANTCRRGGTRVYSWGWPSSCAGTVSCYSNCWWDEIYYSPSPPKLIYNTCSVRASVDLKLCKSLYQKPCTGWYKL